MYNIENERFLVSRDVFFVDNKFPFAALKTSATDTTNATTSGTLLF